MRLNILFLAILASLTSCVNDGGKQDQTVENYVVVGSQLPQFMVNGVNVPNLNSADLSGKRTFLFFFELSCSYCRAELPKMERLWKLMEQHEGVRFVAISRTENFAAPDWAEWTMPVYSDSNRAAFNKFANLSIPRFYIVDTNSEVRWMNVGELPKNLSPEALMELIINN